MLETKQVARGAITTMSMLNSLSQVVGTAPICACFGTWLRYSQYRQGKRAAAQAVLARADAAQRRRCLAAWFMEARSSQQARVQHRAAVKHWRLYKLWRALQSWRSHTAGQAAKAQAKQLAETFR